MGITEGIIIAVLTVIGSVLGAYFQSRHTGKKTAVEMYNALCAAQQQRIMQLQDRLDKNEQEMERLRAQLAEIQGENVTLRERVRVLEDERTELLQEIAKLKQQQGHECNNIEKGAT